MGKAAHKGNVEEPPAGAASDTPKYPGKGFRLGEYVIEQPLGQGSMATVYLAKDPSENEVAIKVFVEGAGVSATMLERFRREAEASKKLRRHPNILTVYSSGKEGPYHYIVMENIQRSKTLENALESTSMSMADIMLIGIKIARALLYAHERRILHRDIKPTNILIDEFGEPRLSDFGVAALIDWPSCTVTGALTGTPLYMSPEQARTDGKLTPASDIYSLGVVLYESLAGVLPYHASHGSPVQDVLNAVKEEEPRRPRLFRKEISADLEAVLLKTLEKEPRERYLDAGALAIDLERALMGRPVSARHFNALDLLRHRIRRHRQALLTLLFAGAAAIFLHQYFRSELLHVQYEGLIHYAQLQNIKHQTVRPSPPEAALPEARRAWHQIRLARNAMRAGDWMRGEFMLNAAVGLSDAANDFRTTAIAHLDEARCAIMQYRQDHAMTIYRHILLSEHASPTTIAMAQMEYVALALLRGEDNLALDVFREVPIPDDGPIRPLTLCLGGELAPEELRAMIHDLPARYQVVAHLVTGIRFLLDGNARSSTASLKSCIQRSSPSTDWPAPFARMILSDLIQQ